LFGGGKLAHEKWLRAYCSEIEAYILAKRFVGKDQSVMLSTYLNDRSLAFFVRATDGDNPWFFLTRLCSCKNFSTSFDLDASYL